MNNATEYAAKLGKLLDKIRKEFPLPKPDRMEPVAQLIQSMLAWEATLAQAEEAHGRLLEALVDHNDLRVSHLDEVVALIGPKYPLAGERATRLHDCLQEIYVREYATSLDGLAGATKKEVLIYLDSLPGITQYVAARVYLLAYDGHAIPVDTKLAAQLIDKGVVDSAATDEEIANFLGRHIPAADAAVTHAALQAWSDANPVPANVTVRTIPQSQRHAVRSADPSALKSRRNARKPVKKAKSANEFDENGDD